MKQFAILLVVVGAGVATSQVPSGDKKLPLDKEFLAKAGSCVSSELEAIKIAEKRAESPMVKKFAMSLHKDHQSWTDRIAGLMKTHKVEAMAAPDKEMQEQVKKLNGVDAKDFDQAFLKLLIDEHKKAIPVIDNQAKNGTLADIRECAQEMSSELRRHLARAEELQKNPGK